MVHVKRKLLHSFIADLIKPGSVVVDLGANQGEFSDYMAKDFNAEVYAIEPVPELFNRIPASPRLKKFQYCVSGQNKPYQLHLPDSQCATLSDKVSGKKKVIIVEGITLKTFLENQNINRVNLLKIDIEGAEIEMFENLEKETLAKLDQITVEFHDFLWPELKSKVEGIKHRLSENGFYCLRFTFFNNGDILFIKKNLIPRASYLYLKFFIKYKMGFSRFLKRCFQ